MCPSNREPFYERQQYFVLLWHTFFSWSHKFNLCLLSACVFTCNVIYPVGSRRARPIKHRLKQSAASPSSPLVSNWFTPLLNDRVPRSQILKHILPLKQIDHMGSGIEPIVSGMYITVSPFLLQVLSSLWDYNKDILFFFFWDRRNGAMGVVGWFIHVALPHNN